MILTDHNPEINSEEFKSFYNNKYNKNIIVFTVVNEFNERPNQTEVNIIR